MKIHRDRQATPTCAKRRPLPSAVARTAAPDCVGPLGRRHHSALRGPPCRYTCPSDHGVPEPGGQTLEAEADGSSVGARIGVQAADRRAAGKDAVAKAEGAV